MKKHLKKIIVFAANAALVLVGVVLIENYENNKNNQEAGNFSNFTDQNGLTEKSISQNQEPAYVQENTTPANNNIATKVVPNNSPSLNAASQPKKTKPKTRTS